MTDGQRLEGAVPLPIDAVLGEVRAALASQTSCVLVAPPGAGKTTRVPLALLQVPWASTSKIILLEPRRLAARAAADRMARTLGETVGGLVGLRARFDTRVSARTRIEVVTEGVFTRMILDDPGLDGVAAVIFDEFHERSLDADLGLALVLESQAAMRDDLRLLVMSATLDGARVAAILDGAPIVTSEGRAFPVTTHHIGRNPTRTLEEDVAAAILITHAKEQGSILAFLPGQREITRVATHLEGRIGGTVLAPLFGTMDRAAQDRAVAPAPAGSRKIVLATSIAETSLTIEGVRAVVDSGMARIPRFEADLGLTRLDTVRVSRAAADQRRGRAGRTEPGVCYRLWEEAGTGALPLFARPEILDADLSGLLLDLAAWGARDPGTLRWLDPPPQPAVVAARRLLEDLGALDAAGAITPEGRAIAALPVAPRLGRMVMASAHLGAPRLGAELAVLLTERGLGGTATDATERLERWRRDRAARADAARGLAAGLARTAMRTAGPAAAGQAPSVGHLLALAYPERMGMARGRPGSFLLANGRAASVEPHDALAQAGFLAIGELTGKASSSRILVAASLTQAEVEAVAADRIQDAETLSFDAGPARLSLRRTRRIGALVLTEQSLPLPPTAEAASRLATGIAGLGIERLPWSKATRAWRGRVRFLHASEGSLWPDLSDEALQASIETWLAPYLLGKIGLADIVANDLATALYALLPYPLARRLDLEAPESFEAPTGTRLTVNYDDPAGPSIAVRVQELFGLSAHPTLADGRVALTLHLLSPAHRPIQITKDLPGFWRGSWSAVRSDMKGRYPRHPWPDDPASAAPTSRAKPRGS